MSLDSDVIVDRRRIRRKLTFWRVAAVLVAIAAIVTVGVVATPGGRSAFTTSGSIARVHIDGLIRSDNDRVEALERLEKSRAAAVVVHINSPGGTTAGSEQLYDALMRLKAKKPRTGGFLPAARRSISSWSINSAMRKPPLRGWWRRKASRAICRCVTTSCRHASAT